MVELWRSTAVSNKIDIVVTADADDLASIEAAKSIPGVKFHVQDKLPGTCVKGWNLAAHHAIGQVLVAMSDDFVPPKKWDLRLEKASQDQEWMNKPAVVLVNDGYVGDLCTLAIVTRPWYEKCGYLFYPGYQSIYCLHPDSLVYMANQTFKPISEVVVGDAVVGSTRVFGGRGDKVIKRRTLVHSRVLATHSRRASLVRVVLESGRVLKCTSDHKWAHYDGYREFEYNVPKIGRRLVRAVEIPENPPIGCEHELGWLAGMYDGEGCFPSIAQSKAHNPENFSELERLLTKFNFSYSTWTGGDGGPCVLRLRGGHDTWVRFFNWTRPVKWNSTQARRMLMCCRSCKPDKIVAVEPCGTSPVYCLTTETRNFIADGYLSHNCDTELTYHARQENALINATHIMFEHHHPDNNLRRKDSVDLVHSSSQRYMDGEKIFKARRAARFPVDMTTGL